MNDLISDHKSAIAATIEHLKEKLKSVRTGRAHTGMIENIIVETYGGSTKMKLREMATITVDGSSALAITLYDPSTGQDVEKAIQASPLGINPQREGSTLILRVPPLSEEQRMKYSKFVSQLVEETKMKIRGLRDEVRKKIKRMEDEKSITEDMRFRAEKEIDQHITSVQTELQQMKEQKEQELMAV